MEIRDVAIVDVGEDDAAIRAVLRLAKKARHTVGFLPDSAFVDRARQGTLLAVDAANVIVGSSGGLTADNDVPKLLQVSHQFHETIWRAARNDYLYNQLQTLRGLIERIHTTTLYSQRNRKQNLTEHRQILDAISDQDQARAQTLTENHFRRIMAWRISMSPLG